MVSVHVPLAFPSQNCLTMKANDRIPDKLASKPMWPLPVDLSIGSRDSSCFSLLYAPAFIPGQVFSLVWHGI